MVTGANIIRDSHLEAGFQVIRLAPFLQNSLNSNIKILRVARQTHIAYEDFSEEICFENYFKN